MVETMFIHYVVLVNTEEFEIAIYSFFFSFFFNKVLFIIFVSSSLPSFLCSLPVMVKVMYYVYSLGGIDNTEFEIAVFNY